MFPKTLLSTAATLLVFSLQVSGSASEESESMGFTEKCSILLRITQYLLPVRFKVESNALLIAEKDSFSKETSEFFRPFKQKGYAQVFILELNARQKAVLDNKRTWIETFSRHHDFAFARCVLVFRDALSSALTWPKDEENNQKIQSTFRQLYTMEGMRDNLPDLSGVDFKNLPPEKIADYINEAQTSFRSRFDTGTYSKSALIALADELSRAGKENQTLPSPVLIKPEGF